MTTSFMDRLRAKMNGASTVGAAMADGLSRAAEIVRHRNVIKANRWDERVWAEARKTEPIDQLITNLEIGDAHRGGERQPYLPAPELVKDVWMTLYKAAPEMRKKREMVPECYANRRVVEEMAKNPKLVDLQDLTAGDPVYSTMGLEAMAPSLVEIIGRVPPPPPPPGPGKPKQKKQKKGKGEKQTGEGQGQPAEGEQGDEPGDNEQGQGQGQGQQPAQQDPNGQEGQEGQGQGSGQSSESDAEQSEGEDEANEQEDLTEDAEEDEFDPEAEDAENQEEKDWQDEFDKALDDLDLDRAINTGLEDADREAQELEDLRKGIGLEDGEWQTMDPTARAKFAKRLMTPQMKMLSEVIGRMKRFALGVKARRVTDVPHEAFDVETGNDMRRVLRSELALLATPETTYEFYRKFGDKELLQYKMRGSEEVGKGPIVIAIDKSGSMNGQPFMWAMAVAESLRRFAAEEERDYYAMFFGANNDRERFDFPKGEGPFEKVMTFLSCVANGGTQFDGVLTEALEKASKSYNQDGLSKADIVFVTDGMASLSEEWITAFNVERERVGVRVYSVYIGGSYDYGHTGGPLGLLGKISDVTIPVRELKPEAVEQIFAHV